MFTVQFTATVFNPDTEDNFNGWVDPAWNRYELRELADDVRTWTFDTLEEAEAFIEETIGSTRQDSEPKRYYYAEDSDFNRETGEDWSYCAVIEEF
jgi:hypothetical protein